MAGKKKIRRALVEGATQGLVGSKLYAFIKERAPDVSNQKIVHTALLTLSDTDIVDRNMLNVIYGLAIAYRLGEDAMASEPSPAASSPSKKRQRRSVKAA